MKLVSATSSILARFSLSIASKTDDICCLRIRCLFQYQVRRVSPIDTTTHAFEEDAKLSSLPYPISWRRLLSLYCVSNCHACLRLVKRAKELCWLRLVHHELCGRDIAETQIATIRLCIMRKTRATIITATDKRTLCPKTLASQGIHMWANSGELNPER